MMELYKREKANPLAGCLPIVIQIPIFFALYKVLFVTIEMRQAPFYGWIKDLSAPDSANIFTAFGLIPYDPADVHALGRAADHHGHRHVAPAETFSPQAVDPVQQRMIDVPADHLHLHARELPGRPGAVLDVEQSARRRAADRADARREKDRESLT